MESASSSSENFRNPAAYPHQMPRRSHGDLAYRPVHFQFENYPAPRAHREQNPPRVSMPPPTRLFRPEENEPNFESFGLTENQIKFRRRFYYTQRERRFALAIVDPQTKEILLPGKVKIGKEEKELKRKNAIEADQLNRLFLEKQKLRREALDREMRLLVEQHQQQAANHRCPIHDFNPAS